MATLDKVDNPLKNAPHTAAVVTANEWEHAYSRQTAAFPLPYVLSVNSGHRLVV
jgi:glycine dehydrogenase